MTSTGSIVERTIVVLTGFVVLAAGATVLSWQQGWIPGAIDQVDMGAATEWPTSDWWPWVTAGAGLVLLVVGLAWLSIHARRRTVGRLRLAGSGTHGRFSVDNDALIDAALASFDHVGGSRRRSGRIWRDAGKLTAELRITVSPDTDLAEVSTAAENAARRIRHQLGDDTPLQFRTVLVSGGKRRRRSTRVR